MTYDQWLDLGNPINDPTEEELEELDDLYEASMDEKRLHNKED